MFAVVFVIFIIYPQGKIPKEIFPCRIFHQKKLLKSATTNQQWKPLSCFWLQRVHCPFLQSTGPNLLSESTGPNFFCNQHFFAINWSQLFIAINWSQFFCKQHSISSHFHCLASEFTKDDSNFWGNWDFGSVGFKRADENILITGSEKLG